MAAYGKLEEKADACARTDRWGDFPCAGYAADGLVRLAALARARGDDERARRALAAFDRLWSHPDEDLEPVRRAAELRAKPQP